MTGFIRDDVVRYERHLIYFAGLGAASALFGGLALLPTALLLGNPLTNTTGQMALGLLALGTAYLVGGGTLARRQSTAALALLATIFVLLSTVGTLLISGGAIVPGLLGLYICYRAATDADYDLPMGRSLGT